MRARTSFARSPRVSLVCGALILPLLLACQQKSGPERVEELRAGYQVSLNGFIVREAPVAAPAPEATPAAEGAEPGAAAAAEPSPSPEPGAEGEAAADAMPAERDVVLDLLVYNDSADMLPGITVDVSQAGEDEVEKAHYRVWIDTSRIARGQSAQITHVLEAVPFTAGDRFAVEVVSPVPPDQRGDYREFQAQ